MFVKKFYSGLCISYPATGKPGPRNLLNPPTPANTSRLGRQKRAVHDAVEWMRRNATHKPLIFCLTVPVTADYKLQNTNVSKFCEVLRRRRGVVNYVWVREFQKNGRPHYHFVADAPRLDVLALSQYWSGLFDSTAVNSIRLGTAPGPDGKRKYFVDSPRMARYLTKYMGKGFGQTDFERRRVRAFHMTQEVAAKSAPITYAVKYDERKGRRFDVSGKINGIKYRRGDAVEVTTGITRRFTITEKSEAHLIATFGAVPDHLQAFDDSKYSWICPNPLHRVYYGLPGKRQKADRKSPSIQADSAKSEDIYCPF